MSRSDVRFPSGTDSCAAWLYRPETAGARVPCVVMAHGFAGTRGARLDAYAERFAAAGLAVLLFDYRHFGDSGGQPRQLLSIGRQLADWRAAVAHARALDGIDPERIVLWGTSFSGGHVVRIAAEDERIAAVISQAPFMDGLATLRENSPAQVLRLTAAGLRDVLAAVRGVEPVTIPAVGPPGSTAFMTSPDAEPGYLAIVPPGTPWENRAAARVALLVGAYRPGAKAGRIRCPWLVQIADRDVVTPPGPAAAAAGRAPQGEVRRYDAGHFDVYVGDLFERVVADELAFLERVLGVGASAPRAA
jgi:dienelactone hydrolase